MVQVYPKIKERRKEPDKFIKIVNGIVLISVLLAIFIFLVAFTPGAYRDFIGIRDLRGIFGQPVQKNMMRAAFYLMLIQLMISITGVILSMLYHKRRNDKYHYSLMIFGALSLAGIALYLLFP